MTIVSNSSPLIALSSVDRLDIMQLLFDTVIIPVSVRDEVMDTAAKIAVELPSLSANHYGNHNLPPLRGFKIYQFSGYLSISNPA